MPSAHDTAAALRAGVAIAGAAGRPKGALDPVGVHASGPSPSPPASQPPLAPLGRAGVISSPAAPPTACEVPLADEINHPSIGVLSDLYHITHDGQSYDETREAISQLRHVHVAGLGRRAPTAADYAYLREYFAVLKAAGYEGRISIEARWESLEAQIAGAREVLGRAWEGA